MSHRVKNLFALANTGGTFSRDWQREGVIVSIALPLSAISS
ncbi:hypothetical protein [Bosea sp. BIWAKO-01]|nr:hypothetical protein [Bosea sp. BIWAKO-01]